MGGTTARGSGSTLAWYRTSVWGGSTAPAPAIADATKVAFNHRVFAVGSPRIELGGGNETRAAIAAVAMAQNSQD